MKVNNFPFKYMVWNIYGNNFLRSSTSYEIFNILSKSHNQYKISHISCNVNTYMYKLSQTCNNKHFNENKSYNIIINDYYIFNICDIYNNNNFIKKISKGIYKPVNIYVYDKNDIMNANNDLEKTITMPFHYTYYKDVLIF